MVRRIFIGVLAPLLLLGRQVQADWRTPISGARPILPSTFLPQGYTVIEPIIVAPEPTSASHAPVSEPAISSNWSLPLVDRTLSERERTADIAPALQDAILRIEPIYDATRLEGPDALPAMAVSAGTASMDNVFADRWRLAATDPNVNTKTVYLATAWTAGGPKPCETFSKNRAHGFGDPALTALNEDDCRSLKSQQARDFGDRTPIAIAPATIDVPVFAAPLPGSRLSSEDFWATRRAQIAAIQAHLQRKWASDAIKPTQVGAR